MIKSIGMNKIALNRQIMKKENTCLKTDIITHLHYLFLFQCDVTRSLNRYESPEQTVY